MMKKYILLFLFLLISVVGFSQICSTPGTFSISVGSVEANSVAITWTAASNVGSSGGFLDEDGYQVSYKLSSASTYTNFGTYVDYNDTRSKTITGLSGGTSYTIRVTAYNYCTYYNSGDAIVDEGITGTRSITVTVVTDPAAPTISSTSAASPTGFTVNYSSVTGADEYEVGYSSNGGLSYTTAVDAASPYTNSSLTGNTTYRIRVRAKGANGAYSAYSSTADRLTKPGTPSINTPISISSTGFIARWTAPTGGAATYYVDISTSNTFSAGTFHVKDLDVGNVSSYAATGLNPGTTYYYRVYGGNASGYSATYSGTQSALTAPAAPVALDADEISQESFTLNWNSSSSATSYRVVLSPNSNLSSPILDGNVGNVTSHSLTEGLVSAGQEYFYAVYANNGTQSPISNIIRVVTTPPTPVAGAADNLAQESFRANWQAVTSALPTGQSLSYRLQVATDDAFNSLVFDQSLGNVLNHTVTSLSSGTHYYYRVAATNDGGNVFSPYSSTIEWVTIPATPTAQAASDIAQTHFTANWQAVTTDLLSGNALSYYLQIDDDSDFSSPIFEGDLGDVTSHTQSTGLSAGNTYFYQVRASNDGGVNYSPYSSGITVVTTPPTPVASAGTSMGQTSFVANWQAVTSDIPTGQTLDYLVEVATTDQFDELVAEIHAGNAVSQSVTGLIRGTEYFYRVSVSNDGQNTYSPHSNVIQVVTAPANPIALAASNINQTQFRANWQAVSADVLTGQSITYYLQVDDAQDFATPIYEDNQGTSLQRVMNSGFSAGETYFYRVKVSNNGGLSYSGYSTAIPVVTTPPNPLALDASVITQTSFTANWEAPATDVPPGQSLRYRLQLSTFEGFDEIQETFLIGNEESLAIASGIEAGESYYYRVQVSNDGGQVFSGFSNEIKVITLPANPQVVAADNRTQQSFRAKWQASTADIEAGTSFQYYLILDDEADFVTPLVSTDLGDVLFYDASGLAAGSDYFYKVRVSNNGGASYSDYSQVQRAVTLPANPVAIAAISIESQSFTARWNAVVSDLADGVSALQYFIEVDDQSDFSSPFIATQVGNVTSLSVTSGLQAGTTYYYRVRVSNDNGAQHSGFSNAITVVTAPPAPVALAAQGITQEDFTAHWQAVASDLPVGQSLTYYIQVDDANDFSSPVFEGSAAGALNQSVSNLEKGTSYFYRVKVSNNGGQSFSPYSNVISVITIPAAPVSLSAQSISDNTFVARWNTAIGASAYRLEVATSPDFAELVSGYEDLLVTGGSLSEQSVDGLNPGTAYYYRLRAQNTSGQSEYSASQTVVTIPSPPQNVMLTSLGQTSFAVKWDAVTADVPTGGGLSYAIQVDNDSDFSSPLVSEWIGDLTEKTINASLLAGSRYFVRVQSSNTLGNTASAFSSTLTVVTVPSTPTVGQADAITQTSFLAQWEAVTTEIPDGQVITYGLQVAKDAAFAEVVFEEILGNILSQEINGLENGTTYFYRVKISNNGSEYSPYSVARELITVPSAPDQPLTNSVLYQQFTLTWEPVQGAEDYLVDVSSDQFASFVSGFERAVVNGTSVVVNGLQAGTVYQMRVSARNISGTSPSSTVAQQITVPTIPTGLQMVSQETNAVFVQWSGVNGVANYLLDVSLSDQFTSFVTGYNGKTVSGALTEHLITGLTASTVYYVRVRAQNAGGTSENSSPRLIFTLNTSGGNDNALEIEDLDFPSTFGQSGSIVAIITGGLGNKEVKLFHRGISTVEYTEEVLSSTNNTFSSTLSVDWFDELGMEFYLSTHDEAGQEVQSERNRIYRTFNEVEIPVPSFGGKLEDYVMVSLPFLLEDNRMEEIFETVEVGLGTYERDKWRLVHYQNGAYIDYDQGLRKSRLEPGMAVWLNTKKSINLRVLDVKAIDYHQDKPFVLSLQQGWNQIANPYNFPINWEDVLAHNNSPEVGNYMIFNSTSLSFESSNRMEPFQGGFVWADADIDLLIPVTLKLTTEEGGRNQGMNPIAFEEETGGWNMPLTLKKGNRINRRGGIGMYAAASEGKDAFDEMEAPALGAPLSLSFATPSTWAKGMSKSIVPTADAFIWPFEVKHEGSASEATVLSWELPSNLPTGSLYLWDKVANRLVNMLMVNVYELPSGASSMAILYNSQMAVEEESLQLGVAYPNPTRGRVTLALGLAYPVQEKMVEWSVSDMTGKLIYQSQATMNEQGIQQIVWEGITSQGEEVKAGIYFLRATYTAMDGQLQHVVHKICKE